MRISVKAKTGSKENKVEKQDDIYVVYIKARPVEGKANAALVKVLAEHFDVAPSCVVLAKGTTSKYKLFDIDR